MPTSYNGKNCPAWAVAEFSLKDRKIAALERELAEARGDGPTDAWAFTGYRKEGRRGIVGPKDGNITIPIGDSYLDVQLMKGRDGAYVTIRAEHSIILQPQSGNVINVKPGEWF